MPPRGHKRERDKASAEWKANKARTRFDNSELKEEDYLEEEYDPMIYVLVAKGTTWDNAQYGPPADNGSAHIKSFAG